MDNKIKDLEKQIKSIKLKEDLQFSIEKDITKRRAMTLNLKKISCSIQTDTFIDQPHYQNVEMETRYF